MRKILFVTAIASSLMVSCKKDRICYCTDNNNKQDDFSNTYYNTKRKAKAACENQENFWSPDWTCTLK